METMETVCCLSLGGMKVKLGLRYPETVNYFRRFLDPDGVGDGAPVRVSEQAFADWEAAGNPIDAFAEFCLLCQAASEQLMEQGGCVFHGAALRYRDRAILLSGGSGSGKSTHLQMLLKEHPEDFSVINGDKPVLALEDQGVMVYPSPWNGKEGLRGADAAPLAAIYFLNRTDRDAVEPCPPRMAGAFAFPMVFQSYSEESVIRQAASVTDKILRAVPCFLFHTRDIEASSRMLFRSIEEVCKDGV